jgi:hypothetical protein
MSNACIDLNLRENIHPTTDDIVARQGVPLAPSPLSGSGDDPPSKRKRLPRRLSKAEKARETMQQRWQRWRVTGRPLSASGRARISAAQKRRWAAWREVRP